MAQKSDKMIAELKNAKPEDVVTCPKCKGADDVRESCTTCAGLGQVRFRPRPGKAPCSQEGCTGKTIAVGLCLKHYQQKRRGRLGKSRAKTPSGRGDSIRVFTGADLKKKLWPLAKKANKSLSWWVKDLILAAVAEAEGAK